MYLYYSLISAAVIFLTALFIYTFLKRKTLLDKKNKLYLMLSTVLAVVCALVIPLLAKAMVKGLYLSIFSSVALSLIISVVLGWIIFYYLVKSKIAADYLAAPGHKENAASGSDSPYAENIGQAVSAVTAGLEEACSIIAEEAAPISTEEITAVNTETVTAVSTQEAPPVSTEEVVPANTERAAPINIDESVAIISDEILKTDADRLSQLLDEAMKSKMNHELIRAVTQYEAALLNNPGPELMAWIIIDLCSLYKMTNQRELVHKILDSEFGRMLNVSIKEDILRNI